MLWICCKIAFVLYIIKLYNKIELFRSQHEMQTFYKTINFFSYAFLCWDIINFQYVYTI